MRPLNDSLNYPRYALLVIRAQLAKQFSLRIFSPWILISEILATLTGLLIFFLISHFFGDSFARAAPQINTSYFGYVSLGLAICHLSEYALGGILAQTSEERSHHTWEHILASPLSLQEWTIFAGIANLGRAYARFALLMATAVFLLGLKIPTFHIWPAIFLLVFAVLPMWSLAAISLGIALVVRRGDPFGWLLMTGFELLGGIYVPTSFFPQWLAQLAEFLPITPLMRAMNAVVYQNASWASIYSELKSLLLLTAFYLPLALLTLRLCDKFCRKRGYYGFS